MLEVDVTVPRGGFHVEASFSVAPGEGLVIVGPSGAGKTTVLESVAGLVTPSRGRIGLGARTLFAAGGPSVAAARRHVGLVRQRPALFPHLDVEGNIFYAKGRAPEERIRHVIARLGLGELLHRRPRELSGGQAHRVAIARVLASECEALLLDEPFDGLDRALRQELMGLVASLTEELAIPLVVVTHTLDDVLDTVDRLLVLDGGRLLQEGPLKEVLRRPATRTIARLVGYRAFAPLIEDPALVAGVHPGLIVPDAYAGPGVVVVTGTVRATGAAGWDHLLRVDVGDDQVEVWTPGPVVAGSDVRLRLLDPPIFRDEARLELRPGGVTHAQR